MNTQKGIVRRVEDGWAWVMTWRTSACGRSCGDCGTQSSCHIVEGLDRIVVKTKNVANARIGDEVDISLSPKTKIKGMLVLYILPVLGLLVGAFSAEGLSRILGLSHNTGLVLFTFCGLVLAFLAARIYGKRMEQRQALTPWVSRVLKRRRNTGFSHSHIHTTSSGKRTMRSKISLLFITWLTLMICLDNVGLASPEFTVGTIDSAGIDKMIKTNNGLTVIVMMAAWCVPCREELPTLVKLYNRHKVNSLNMVGISIDFDGPNAIKPMLEKAYVTFPVYWAGETAVRDYNISAIPILFLVKDGKIVEKIYGKQSEKFLDKKITDLL